MTVGQAIHDGHAQTDGASLRDPMGHVFHEGGRVLRSMKGEEARRWLAWFSSAEAIALFGEGWFVGTRTVDVRDGGSEGFAVVLEHERVEWISYSQEWCFSMLRDAALLHLDLMERLLPTGAILKDANPANVQWHDGRLRFIDVASVQSYAGGAWRAYGQFCQTMLFPLLVSAYGGVPLNLVLKGCGRNGLPASLAAKWLRGRAAFRPGVFTHVRLQTWLQRFIDRFGMPALSEGQVSTVSADAVLRMVAGLRRVLQRMPTPASTAWSQYVGTSTYSVEQTDRKKALVEAWLGTKMPEPRVVLDVGCNTGTYAKVAAARVRQVIAVDTDMACVDELWRTRTPNILPLVVDLSDPTPAAGWALSEQRSFPSRVKPDVSLWLAVIHHLAVHNGIRLPEVVRRLLATSPWVVIEFVDPEDEMVRALLAERAVERPDYTRAGFLQSVVAAGAEVREVAELSATRQLYLITTAASASSSATSA